MTSTVAIVNWNSGDLLRTCIESILATTTSAKILVIDNASGDSSLDCTVEFRDRANVIRLSDNRGFAGGVNQAFRWTSTPYVLILNPDIQVLPGAIQLLEEFMEEYPRAGAAGGYVGEKYLPRPFPTTRSLILENLGVQRLTVAPLRSGPARVDQVAAAALMIRRQAYEEAGGFDEHFHPAWYEDVDYCHRVTRCGWQVYFVPAAEFIHKGGYSTGALGNGNFLRAYYRNQVLYARKHLGSMAAALVRASAAVGAIGRMIGRPHQAGAYAKAFIGVLKEW
jgi:GT2 family glycosyltransferase